jgi:neutral ceramidase
MSVWPGPVFCCDATPRLGRLRLLEMVRVGLLVGLGIYCGTTQTLAQDAAVQNAGVGFRAGAATSNITPEIGGAIIGGFADFPSTHVHDELHARCLVLDDGKTKLALVVVDLIGIHRRVSEEARRLIQESTGIPRECVLISATHTHSATSALGKDRWTAEPPLSDYQTFVARRIADGVRSALNNARPAEFAFISLDVPEHVFNRRWHLRVGTMPPNPFGTLDLVKMNPGSGPNLEEPAGPIDPAVSILAVREPNGPLISVHATYSLHYVGGVRGSDISADYYGMFSERLRELVENDSPREPSVAGDRPDAPKTPAVDRPAFVAMMANGTSGDINNINFKNPRPSSPPYAQMRFVADDLASKVHAGLRDLKWNAAPKLAARYAEPELKWRKPTPAERAWAEKTLALPVDDPKKVDLSRIYAQRAMALAEYPETTPVPVQVLSIGGTIIGTLPCEVLCEIGLEFKERSPLQPAYMVELAHAYYGYLPPPRQHDLGGYETWIGTNRLEREASVKLLDTLLKMVDELKQP